MKVAYLQEEIEILGNQMANFTPVDGIIASCGSSVANHNSNNPIYAGSQLISHHDYAINIQNYNQNQQELVHSHAENNESANYDQALDPQIDIQVPLCGLMEEQNLLCGGHNSDIPESLEKLFELGTYQENLENYPWVLDGNTLLL